MGSREESFIAFPLQVPRALLQKHAPGGLCRLPKTDKAPPAQPCGRSKALRQKNGRLRR